jgi:hypothetical protein
VTFEAAKGLLRLDASAASSGRTHVEEIGFRPRVLVLWWSLQDDHGTALGNRGGIGIAAESSEEAAAAWAADDAASAGVLSRWGGHAALLGFDNPRATAAALSGRVAWMDRGFALDYAESTSGIWHVHYLALGGSDLRHAAVRRLALDRSGPSAVRGLGFRPDLLLFLPGAGGTVSEPMAGLAHAFGAATGPDAQAAAAFTASVDGTRTSVCGAQRTDAVVALPDPAGSGELDAFARLVSLDPDGFTLETTLRGSTPLPLACLALAGGRYAVGTDAGPRAPKRAVTKDVGFEPSGLLAFTWGLGASEAVKDIGRLCLGGASASTEAGCITWAARNRQAWPLEPRVRSTTESLVEVLDTRSGGLHARAALEKLRSDGFSLDWLVSDGYRREFAYVAFGSVAPPRRFRDRLRDAARVLE